LYVFRAHEKAVAPAAESVMKESLRRDNDDGRKEERRKKKKKGRMKREEERRKQERRREKKESEPYDERVLEAPTKMVSRARVEENGPADLY
jgi:hypothetical protein